MRRTSSLIFVFVVCAVAVADRAEAGDTWSNPHPGVRHLERTTNAPNRIHATVVDLCHAGISLRATKSSERGQTVSSFARSVDVEIAVNGDFFEGNYEPIGLAVGDGRPWPGTSDDGTHGFIGFGDERTEVSNPPATVGSPPGWIDDAVGGNILVVHNGTVTNDTGTFCTTRHPRTAAGMSKDGRELILAVVDGRSTQSRGMRCDELGRLMKELGAHRAINLDGGGSTTMWIRNLGVVNSPSDGQERVVANHLALQAEGGTGVPEACPEPPDFEIAARWSGVDNFYRDGSSSDVPDVLAGASLTAELLIQNKSLWRMPNVIEGYWFEHPFLRATDYTIYSDHPEHDRQSWKVNSADSESENPPKDGLGEEGFLHLHAFAPKETKKVVLELEAPRYSVGAVDHPDVRTWVKHVAYVYGEQDGFYQKPSNANRVGRILRDFAQIDVLSRNEWQFDGGDGQREGWRRCRDGLPALEVSGDSGVLRAPSSEGESCLKSPGWTRVDTDRFGELVLRARSAAGARMSAEITWADGTDRSGSVGFEHRFSGEVETLVVPVGTSARWQGGVEEFRVASTFQDTGRALEIDAMFFQDRAAARTSSEREDVVSSEPVELVDSTSDDSGDAGLPGDGGGLESGEDGGASEGGPAREDSSGCGCGHRSAPPPGAFLFVVLGIVALCFRRQ